MHMYDTLNQDSTYMMIVWFLSKGFKAAGLKLSVDSCLQRASASGGIFITGGARVRKCVFYSF